MMSRSDAALEYERTFGPLRDEWVRSASHTKRGQELDAIQKAAMDKAERIIVFHTTNPTGQICIAAQLINEEASND